MCEVAKMVHWKYTRLHNLILPCNLMKGVHVTCCEISKDQGKRCKRIGYGTHMTFTISYPLTMMDIGVVRYEKLIFLFIDIE